MLYLEKKKSQFPVTPTNESLKSDLVGKPFINMLHFISKQTKPGHKHCGLEPGLFAVVALRFIAVMLSIGLNI